ncbi:Dimethylsulfonioproprionate lyase (DMSP lyase) (Symbiodinium-A1) [Durusdinium trenchii]|uniref:Dimethylsulfonioproprionate lyase (DMSP lyase) (Symbiodinium-A1) n=1 Tax=Durusdinium trenchii TaxID=1381693 RepID=A0ABP0S0V6_9DINO
MANALVVLQLDTQFPRIPGDIACKETYLLPIHIEVIDRAHVADVVSLDPEALDISRFASALAKADAEIISTSCGFMVYFQKMLSELTQKTFISSALVALPKLRARFQDVEIMVITFDADILGAPAYRFALDGFTGPVVGLEKSMHLYQVISKDLDHLELECAEADMDKLIQTALTCYPDIGAIMLECTNLPPYKHIIRRHFSGEIVDCLSVLEVESKGVYGFTMVLGENRWETFQIWEDGDPDKAEIAFLRGYKSAVLDEQIASTNALTVSNSCKSMCFSILRGDYMPEGGEIPVVDQDEQLLGMPGDRNACKYRRVEWRKLTTTVPQALRASSYYIAGDFNFWEFQPMQEEASAGSKARSFFTEVKLRSSEDVFQVRNRELTEGPEELARNHAPYGVARANPKCAADVGVASVKMMRVRDEFQHDQWCSDAVCDRRGKGDLCCFANQDVLNVACEYSGQQGPTHAIRPNKVGSWSSFVSKDSMTFDQAKSTWLAEVQVGQSGMEFFQILLNGNWLAAVYPNSYEADFRRNGHVVLGPDSRGGRSYWCLQDGLEPGDRVQVMLEVWFGLRHAP